MTAVYALVVVLVGFGCGAALTWSAIQTLQHRRRQQLRAMRAAASRDRSSCGRSSADCRTPGCRHQLAPVADLSNVVSLADALRDRARESGGPSHA